MPSNTASLQVPQQADLHGKAQVIMDLMSKNCQVLYEIAQSLRPQDAGEASSIPTSIDTSSMDYKLGVLHSQACDLSELIARIEATLGYGSKSPVVQKVSAR